MIIGDCWRVAAEAGVELVPVIWLCRSLAPTLTGRSPRRLARPRLGSLPCQLKLKQSGSPPPTPHHHSTAPRLCQKWMNQSLSYQIPAVHPPAAPFAPDAGNGRGRHTDTEARQALVRPAKPGARVACAASFALERAGRKAAKGGQ